MGTIKRVLLAVDLKAQNPALTKRVWGVLEPLLKNNRATVEPVAVLNREDAAMGKALRGQIGMLQTAAETHLGQQLKKQGLEGLAAPKVIFADGSATQRAVTALIAHAKKTKCDLIAVSSNARKGVSRFFLGSFAETLALQSPIPLLVVSPQQKSGLGKVKTILFPTDFSPNSKAGLEIVCRSFGEKPRIVLFNGFIFSSQLYMEPLAAYPLPQSVFEEEFKKYEETGKAWCRELKAKGVTCELVMDRKSSFVTDGVLLAAKRKKADLIAMVSSTGKLGSTFLGSVTRQILRQSTVPVWVVHPK